MWMYRQTEFLETPWKGHLFFQIKVGDRLHRVRQSFWQKRGGVHALQRNCDVHSLLTHWFIFAGIPICSWVGQISSGQPHCPGGRSQNNSNDLPSETITYQLLHLGHPLNFTFQMEKPSGPTHCLPRFYLWVRATFTSQLGWGTDNTCNPIILWLCSLWIAALCITLKVYKQNKSLILLPDVLFCKKLQWKRRLVLLHWDSGRKLRDLFSDPRTRNCPKEQHIFPVI